MLLLSWNINGIRAIVKKNFVQDIQNINPDVFCLQETKADVDTVHKALSVFSDYEVLANESKTKKGYSGTAIVSKKKIVSVKYDIGIPYFDQEGRVITAEFETFYLVTVYTPNSGSELIRLTFREEWDREFANYIGDLNKKKAVVVCGDLNVAHTDKDLARPKANYNKAAGYTQIEIDGLKNLLRVGLLDTYRIFYPKEVKYSWWNYRFNARSRNVGWRIDYFLASRTIKDRLKNAAIHNDVMGSDHCPVSLEIKT